MYEILNNRTVISISGVDASKFLQNLLTNDICKYNNCYTYMLNNQGRYLFDMFVFRVDKDEFLLDISTLRHRVMIAKLNMYKLRAKINIRDLSNQYYVVYSRLPLHFTPVTSMQDQRYHRLGIRSIVDNRTKITDITPYLYYKDKYTFAIPDGDHDLIYERSIPLEHGAEELNAISYTKGCYIGQEVISRVKYQGIVRKKIYKIITNNSLLSASCNDKVLAGDCEIGTFCSNYLNQGIALIKEYKYLAVAHQQITINGDKVELILPAWRATN